MSNSVARTHAAPEDASNTWLLLSYQVPRNPAAQYMNVYRRLRSLRVLHVRAGLAAMPVGAQAEEALRTVAAHINAIDGGSAILLRSDVLNDVDHLVEAYNDERNVEYDELIDLCARLETTAGGRGRRDDLADRRRHTRLAKQLDAIRERDAFGAPRRQAADEAVSQYGARSREGATR